MTIRQQYDDIAAIYDLLSEGDDGAIYFRMHAEKVLKKLAKGTAVLDCSCGTGDHAIWMARQGLKVHASDISESMLDRAREKAARLKSGIHFKRSSWDELHNHYPKHFDLIMSPGNSFSHLSGMDMLDRSLTGIYESLKPGGIFIFDIRDWEKTFAKNNLPPQEFEAGKRGSKIRVRYVWDMKGWNKVCKMHVETFGIRSSVNNSYVFDFFPLSYDQLKEALLRAGFNHIERKSYPDDNYYFVSAVK